MAQTAAIPLGPEDRAILAVESSTVAGHTCKVLRLGQGCPGVAALRERIAERLHLAPGLTRGLQEVGGEPCWVDDADFDLGEHVVEHAHERPVDWGELRRCVARLFEQRLDRDRPLWRMDVVELEGGERALVWRIHHALADGTAAVRYARALLWDEAPEEKLTAAQTAGRHAADEARRRSHLAGYLRREFTRSRTRSPFDGSIGTRREVGFAAVPLAAVRDAARALDGATLNDAVLGIVTGALRHWVGAHHGHLGSIRVQVPVSMHGRAGEEADTSANRDSLFSLGLPLGEPDPVARLHEIHARTQARKRAHDAEQREVLMHRMAGVSPRLLRFAAQLERSPRRFALSVSNVPGPPRRVTVLGSPVRQLHSLAEISEHHALRVAVISLADLLCFGFCADAELIPDVQTMADRVQPEMQALQARVSAR
jgi:diacylglycerol O-acyltransferase